MDLFRQNFEKDKIVLYTTVIILQLNAFIILFKINTNMGKEGEMPQTNFDYE